MIIIILVIKPVQNKYAICRKGPHVVFGAPERPGSDAGGLALGIGQLVHPVKASGAGGGGGGVFGGILGLRMGREGAGRWGRAKSQKGSECQRDCLYEPD
jgi:hypothetical protein